jgi:hypothetical protein
VYCSCFSAIYEGILTTLQNKNLITETFSKEQFDYIPVLRENFSAYERP